MELQDFQDMGVKISSDYVVQSPASSAEMEEEVIPTPPLVTEENLRFSLRNVQSKLERVDTKAMAVAKKRDLEGLMKGDDREAMERGARMLKENATIMMRICAAAESAPRETMAP